MLCYQTFKSSSVIYQQLISDIIDSKKPVYGLHVAPDHGTNKVFN